MVVSYLLVQHALCLRLHAHLLQRAGHGTLESFSPQNLALLLSTSPTSLGNRDTKPVQTKEEVRPIFWLQLVEHHNNNNNNNHDRAPLCSFFQLLPSAPNLFLLLCIKSCQASSHSGGKIAFFKLNLAKPLPTQVGKSLFELCLKYFNLSVHRRLRGWFSLGATGEYCWKCSCNLCARMSKQYYKEQWGKNDFEEWTMDIHNQPWGIEQSMDARQLTRLRVLLSSILVLLYVCTNQETRCNAVSQWWRKELPLNYWDMDPIRVWIMFDET